MLETLVDNKPKGIEQKLYNELGTVYGTGSFEMYTTDILLKKVQRKMAIGTFSDFNLGSEIEFGVGIVRPIIPELKIVERYRPPEFDQNHGSHMNLETFGFLGKKKKVRFGNTHILGDY